MTEQLKQIPDLTVVIQAGGESKRMGQSKACVPFLGEPLLARGIRRMEPLAQEIIVTTNEPERLNFVPSNVRLERDLLDIRGALSGAYTALKVATNPYVAIVAVDMIAPSRRLIMAEYDALHAEATDIAIPFLSKGFEPFHAVYKRDTCLAAIEKSLDEGGISMKSIYNMLNKTIISADDIHEIAPRGGVFLNANTPEELASAERWVLETEKGE